MSKSSKLVLGALTLLPIVFFGLYIFSFFQFFVKMTQVEPGTVPTHPFPENFALLLVYIMVVVLSSLGLLVYYLIHISKNPKFKEPAQSTNKLIWVLVVIFTGIIGMLIYFILEIWPEKKERHDDLG